jgi:hypothetical protein
MYTNYDEVDRVVDAELDRAADWDEAERLAWIRAQFAEGELEAVSQPSVINDEEPF